MAGDCCDEIPSKSKLQPAGITSCANPANLLVFRCTIHYLQFLAPNSLFVVLFSANFVNILKIRHLHSFFFNFSSFRTQTSFSISHQTVTFHTFSANLEKILYNHLCHLASFNVPSCYHLSLPVLKIFVAASFSF